MFLLCPSPHSSLLFLALLGMVMMSSGFPLPRFHPLESLSSPPIGQEQPRPEQWEMFYPSFSAHDWSIQMMSAPKSSTPKPKSQMVGSVSWFPVSRALMEALTEEAGFNKNRPQNLPRWAGGEKKRNIVVADDAAFRQKSKLLTAMERQKWLNSYMQKLLVINSP